MSDPDRDRLDELFQKAIDLPRDQQASFVDAACEGNAPLREKVMALLRGFDSAERLMPGPLEVEDLRAAADDADDEANDPLIGMDVDGCRVVRRIGYGGMGWVYEARQAAANRRVAIKVMQAASARAGFKRFEIESRTLAQLEHPGIARLYSVGTVTIPGARRPLPYFAMEYVDGVAITDYVRDRNLSTAQRIALVADVCEAAGYAHRRGFVHRDLKPANILAGEADGRPKASIVDFGVAKALTPDHDATGVTETGQIVGTLQYMSPEQLDCGIAAIDQRADVYALGIVLFEVITGKRPYDVAGKTITDAIWIVRETEPERMADVDPALRRDLEAVVGCAMHKEPVERYASGVEMAEDLRRLLRHDPVHARPPTAMYRLSKLTRRHRSAWVTAGAALAVLAISVAMAMAAFSRAKRAEKISDGARPARAFGEYVSAVQAAYAAYAAGDLDDARAKLAAVPEVDRAWEWRHLARSVGLAPGMAAESATMTLARRSDVKRVRPSGTVRYDATRRELEIIDVYDGRTLFTVPNVPEVPDRCAWTADGRWIVFVGMEPQSKTEVRDVATGAVHATAFDLKSEDFIVFISEPHQRLALGGVSGVLRFFSMPDLEPVGETRFASTIDYGGMSPDGELLAVPVRPGSMSLVRFSDGAIIREFETRGGMPVDAVFSDDGRWLFALNDVESNLNQWEVATGRLVRRVVTEHTMCMAIMPTQNRVVVGCADGAVRIYPIEPIPGVQWATTLTRRDRTETLHQISASADGEAFAAWESTGDGIVYAGFRQ